MHICLCSDLAVSLVFPSFLFFLCSLTRCLVPAPLKLLPYGSIQICLLLFYFIFFIAHQHKACRQLKLQPFNGLFSRTTWVSRYQKGKTNLDFTGARTVSGSGISWAVCKSAPRSRQITCQHPTTLFFTGRMPFLPPNQQRLSTVCS